MGKRYCWHFSIEMNYLLYAARSLGPAVSESSGYDWIAESEDQAYRYTLKTARLNNTWMKASIIRCRWIVVELSCDQRLVSRDVQFTLFEIKWLTTITLGSTQIGLNRLILRKWQPCGLSMIKVCWSTFFSIQLMIIPPFEDN